MSRCCELMSRYCEKTSLRVLSNHPHEEEPQ